MLETDRRASNRCLLVFNAVSRAFGDRLLKQYVVAQPDVLEESLTGDDTLLIMATDGLWDVISNQDAFGSPCEVASAIKTESSWARHPLPLLCAPALQ